MFLKELAAAILPWWVLSCMLLMPYSWSHVPLLLIGLYVLLTEQAYHRAKRASERDGFQRIVRMPVHPALLRLLSRGRFQVPFGIPCYTLHVLSSPAFTPKAFFRELEEDIRRGISTDAFYVGVTFYDLASRVNAVIGSKRAVEYAGVLVPGQTWNVDPERQQLLLFNRVFTRPTALSWKLVLIQSGTTT